MGAYAPTPLTPPELLEQVNREVFDPLLAALKAEGITYRGVLYAGLMLTKDGVKILEFNARFGDPETQVMLPLLETPLAEIAHASASGQMADLTLKLKKECTLGVVLASANYPGEPRTGDVIQGLAGRWPETVTVFHSGTAKKGQDIVTAGGRVLTVVGRGKTHAAAAKAAYAAVEKIQFEGRQFRRDIGWCILD
jgi:phosphoribosylamine--glycine ligase